MAKRNDIRIELKPFDDLFETEESRADLRKERLSELSIKEIRNFPDHPYQVKDDEAMMELAESIKTYGLLHPVVVRLLDDGTYEMVSGHRRKRACELAGIETIPARIMGLTRDEAILMMVDSNLQRDEILPSEKAKAYKMRLEAMKRVAGRPSRNAAPVEQNLRNRTSREILAENVGESHAQIQRFIRLTELIPELLDMVDEKKIALRPAVEISYLPKETQQWLQEAIAYADATPSHAQAIKMRKFLDEGKLTQEVLESIMEEEKPNQKTKPAFKDERIIKLIPSSIPMERQTDYVVKALEWYKRYLERKREMER